MNETPEKDELRIYMLAQRVHERREALDTDAPWIPWPYMSHAVEGIRKNGVEDIAEALIDVWNDGRQYLDEEAEHRQRLDVTAWEVRKILSKISELFAVCVACKGEKGSFEHKDGRTPGPTNGWSDCESCDGRGMVRISNDELS